MATIADITAIMGHRIEGEPFRSGKWLVWRSTKSSQTMSKFVGRVADLGVSCFCRDGKFGVLASDLASDAADARADLDAEFR